MSLRVHLPTAPSKGFTLIEALVALSIVAIALTAALKASGQLSFQQDSVTRRQYALLSADNTLQQWRAARVFPPIGVQSFACPQGRYEFQCQCEVSATPNGGVRRVNVQVSEPGSAQYLARLVTFISNAP